MNHIHRFGDAMLFALPILFIKKPVMIYSYLLFVLIYFLSNIWYFRNYQNPMPFSAYTQWQNLNGLGPSIISSMAWIDLAIIFPFILFAIFYYIFYSRNYKTVIRNRLKYLIFISALFIIILIQVPPYITKQKEFASPQNIPKMDLPRAIRQYGLTVFWYYQFVNLKGVTSEQLDFASKEMKGLINKNDIKPLVAPHKKNLILILVESLASWPIELEIEGKPVTPVINTLIQDSTTLYFPKVWPDRRDGRSADGQMIINTGLLPINTGATVTLYGVNEFPSIAKALKEKNNYYSVNFLTGDRNFWNQGATTKSYGFDLLYDHLDENFPSYRADEVLFKNVLNIIKDLPQPFYSQIVTYSTHDQVKTDFKTPLDNIDIKNETVKNHLILTYYVDFQIGQFLNELKKLGLYENSVIVIVSDHDAITKNLFEGREKIEPADRLIPFLVINSPLDNTDTSKVIGQIDIYSSLLDIMGVQDYYFRGLGESVFRSQLDFDKSHLGEIGDGGRNPYIKKKREDMWKLSDILIRSNYFNEYIDQAGKH